MLVPMAPLTKNWYAIDINTGLLGMHLAVDRPRTAGGSTTVCGNVTLISLLTAMMALSGACAKDVPTQLLPGPTAITAYSTPALLATEPPGGRPAAAPIPKQPIIVERPGLTSTLGVPETTDTPHSEVARLGRMAMGRLVALTEQASPRASTSEQERVAAEYIRAELGALGYKTKVKPFNVRAFATGELFLRTKGTTIGEIEVFPILLTAEGSATGPVTNVSRGLKEDIPEQGLEGKIALVKRGGITFQEKVDNVAQEGAVAVVVYNNEPGPFRGTLRYESVIPVVSVSMEEGIALRNLEYAENVEIVLSVKYSTSSENVIAVKPGGTESEKKVVLGAHYDTVPNVPGANDNGSGIATLLEVASEIADKEYAFTVEVVMFGAEEIGLFGSRDYVEELSDNERANIIAMLNFDALGTGKTPGIYGDRGLLDVLGLYASTRGIDVEKKYSMAAGTSSDHAPFAEAGIPVVFFLADDFSRIHSPEDKLEFIRPVLLGSAAAMGVALLDQLDARVRD